MIRLASQCEALEIMRDPDIQKRVGKQAEKFTVQPWIAYNEKHKMLFVFWEISSGTYEVHIACEKASIRSSRELAKSIIKWLFSVGAHRIVTNCPSGKMSNLAQKIGMKYTHAENDRKHYEVLSWALVQQ